MPKAAKIAILVICLLLVGVVALFVVGRKPRQENQRVGARELVVWGVVDSEDSLYGFFAKVQTLTGAAIKYRRFTESEYEKALLEALASGTGPDIFAIRNTWLPKHGNKLSPAPAELVDLRSFQEKFVDVVNQDLVSNERIFGVPFYIDTIGLFYNKDLFNSAGIVRPPQTWDEFVESVKRLTVRNAQGELVTAGAALGTGRNVKFAPEILQLLMMQSGARMTDQFSRAALFGEGVIVGNTQTRPGLSALQFYTDFANSAKNVYTWNENQSLDIDAFIQGKAAMILSTADTINVLKLRSPQLRFGVASAPQTSGVTLKLAMPSYWAFGVSRWSARTNDAWRVLLAAAFGEVMKEYLETAGRVSARRDILADQLKDPLLGAFAGQALIARSWYQADEEAIDDIFRNMIDSVVRGSKTLQEALRAAAEQVTALAKK